MLDGVLVKSLGNERGGDVLRGGSLKATSCLPILVVFSDLGCPL